MGADVFILQQNAVCRLRLCAIQQSSQLIEINDLGTIYKHALSFNLVQIPQDSCRGDSINQTTFFVCVPPYATLEKKRETIELLHNTMVRETGYQGELKNIVLFQYHDDDGVGKDGELFADIKARKAQA